MPGWHCNILIDLMKRIITSIITVMVALMSVLTAKAADEFSYTIRWDNPGAVAVFLNDIYGSAESLDPSATSIVVTQPGYAYLRPAEGYLIKSVTDGDGKSYKISGYKNYGGQYVSLSCYKTNGYVFDVSTEKLEKTGEIEIDVINGDFALEAYLANAESKEYSTFSTVDLTKGSQKVDLTAYDTELVLARDDGKAIYSIKKNGEEVTVGDSGGVAIANGDKIEIQAYETEPERVTVTIGFTEGSEGCLSSVYNQENGKMTPYADIKAAGGILNCNSGAPLRFNFNEDYVLRAITVNGASVELPDGLQFKTVVTENTEVLLDAAAKEYEDIEGVVYIAGPVEGLRFATGIMDYDVEIPISGGDELTDDVVFTYSNGKTFVIKAGTAKKYTLMMPGKSRKFFYDALPGYWIAEGMLANPDDPDYPYASYAVLAENAPLYIRVSTIENDTKAVVFYDGEENAAGFYAHNVRFPGRMEVDGIGGNFLPGGYSIIEFDADYHETFSVGKVGGLETNEIVAYQDGNKLKYSEENMAYSDIKLTEGSVLKVFSVRAGTTPDLHSVKFEIEAGMSAEVTYDLVKAHDPETELQCVGMTKVSVKPSGEANVTLDGEELAADAEGCYEFMTSRKGHVLSVGAFSGVSEIGSAENTNATVFNLQGIRIENDLESLPSGIYIVNGRKVIKQ